MWEEAVVGVVPLRPWQDSHFASGVAHYCMLDDIAEVGSEAREEREKSPRAAPDTNPKRESVLGIPVRESVPPFFLFVNGDVLPNFAGKFWNALQVAGAPSPEETRRTLLHLRERLHWSRPMLAAILSASVHTVRRWETRQRTPKGAARRLVWLLGMILCTPDKLHDGFDFICWGQREELRRWNEALRILSQANERGCQEANNSCERNQSKPTAPVTDGQSELSRVNSTGGPLRPNLNPGHSACHGSPA
jgi:hypothetical protein